MRLIALTLCFVSAFFLTGCDVYKKVKAAEKARDEALQKYTAERDAIKRLYTE